MTKTAMRHLYEMLDKFLQDGPDKHIVLSRIRLFIPVEKQQLEDAFNQGRNEKTTLAFQELMSQTSVDPTDLFERVWIDFDNYFKQTYGTEENKPG